MQNEQKKETKVNNKRKNRSMLMRIGATLLILLMIAPTVLSLLVSVM